MHLLHPTVYKVYELLKDFNFFYLFNLEFVIRPTLVLNLATNPLSLYGLVNKHETTYTEQASSGVLC